MKVRNALYLTVIVCFLLCGIATAADVDVQRALREASAIEKVMRSGKLRVGIRALGHAGQEGRMDRV